MGQLSEIAKRLGVPEEQLQTLYHEMVQADTGRSYADLSAQLSATPTTDAPQVTTEAQAEAQLVANLAGKWGVDVNTATERIERLNTVYETLPEDAQARYGTLDGIVDLWTVVSAASPQSAQTPPPAQPAPAAPAVDLVSAQRNAPPTMQGTSPINLLNGNGRGPKTFSLEQLMDMPQDEYARINNDGSLFAAVTSGNVIDDVPVQRPEIAPRSVLA
jgi:hypothetical protein